MLPALLWPPAGKRLGTTLLPPAAPISLPHPWLRLPPTWPYSQNLLPLIGKGQRRWWRMRSEILHKAHSQWGTTRGMVPS